MADATTKPTEAEVPEVPAAATKDEQVEPGPDSKPSDAATHSDASGPLQELWTLAKANGHPEVWGVTLSDPQTHVPSQIIFQKYLNANDGDLARAKDQLNKTLEWRAQMKPLELLQKKYKREKFEGLGYVTTHGTRDLAEPEKSEVFTWNIYGGVKSIKDTFGNLDEFIAWRVALMEQALQELSLPSATKPITADYDPYKIYQVHDYKSISFFGSPPEAKTASSKTIQVFTMAYPELLKEKFFVNVPIIMGAMYGFIKMFISPKTAKKFHPMSNGGDLAREFGESKVEGLGESLPAEYGGSGKDLKAQGKEPELE